MSRIVKPMSRRTFLRGSGGIMVGLPLLEAMMPSLAWAVNSPKRMVTVYGGQVQLAATLPGFGALPSTMGISYAPFNSIRQHVSILANMKIPNWSAANPTPKPGGYEYRIHRVAAMPALAGMRSYKTSALMENCHSVDQVVADAFPGARFRSIHPSVQPESYVGASNDDAIISMRFNAATNDYQPQLPELSIATLYHKLFDGFTPPNGTTTTPNPALVQAYNKKKSVLDYVLSDMNRTLANVGSADRMRLQSHFDQIRTLENQLQPPTTSAGAAASCAKPTSSMIDPSLVSNWHNETLRGQLQAELIALALACDMTRAVSWALSYDQCQMSCVPISGYVTQALDKFGNPIPSTLHQASHDATNPPGNSATQQQLATVASQKHHAWHNQHFANLVDRLSKMPEGAGSVLDNTFVGLTWGEGVTSHGRDLMHMSYAGCGGVLKLGQCIDGAQQHPARMFITGLQALGIAQNTLGEISDALPEMLK